MKRIVRFSKGALDNIALLYDGSNSSIYITLSASLKPHDEEYVKLVLRKVTDTLNATPDEYGYNPGEVKDSINEEVVTSKAYDDALYVANDGAVTLFSPLTGKAVHKLTAGDRTLFIDGITENNMPNVSAKLLRALYQENLITKDDVKRAHTELVLPKKALVHAFPAPDKEWWR
jgi:fructose-1-phosphate kinase PfkB-like protein